MHEVLNATGRESYRLLKKPMSISHTRISNPVTIVTIFENPKIASTYALTMRPIEYNKI
jgi:hypothetical protein